MKQTKTGVPAVGSENLRAAKYDAASATLGNGATLESDADAVGGQSVQNLHLDNSFFQFNNIDGGKDGGRATIGIYYASADKAKLKLSVNGVDYSFVNAPPTGGWNNYTGYSYLTVPLSAGKANTVKLDGGHDGINVNYITVTPLP